MKILALALVILPQAARWKEIGKTGTGNPVYADTRTIRTAKDGIISATVRVVYTKPVNIPGKGEVTSSRASAMFNCAANTFAVKRNTMFFDEKSNRIYQDKVNQIPGYGPTIGGSFGDIALKYFCAKAGGAGR
jgi:hypothetical protein